MVEISTALSGKRLAMLSPMLTLDCVKLYKKFNTKKVILKKAIEDYEIFMTNELNSIFENSNSFAQIVQDHLINYNNFINKFCEEAKISDGFLNGSSNGENHDQTIYAIIITLKEWYLQSDKGHYLYLMVEIDAFNLNEQEKAIHSTKLDSIATNGENNHNTKCGRIRLLNKPQKIVLTFQNNEMFISDSSIVNKIQVIQDQLKYKKNPIIDKIPEKCAFLLLPKMLFDFRIVNNKTRIKIIAHEKEFNAEGISRIESKNIAARQVLKYFCHYDTEERKLFQIMPDGFENAIENMVYEKAKALRCFSVDNKKSVLSAIVQTHYYNMDTSRIVTITNGTKNIDGDSLTEHTVNDTHAEVIARRCLLKYFYDQLLLAMDQDNKHQSIFIEQFDDSWPGFQLRDGIKFHLYISRGPCGAASIRYGKNNIDTGKLRAKVEKDMAYDVVDNIRAEYQSKELIHQGEPLYTASCSDKIARWNIVGLQGALLSRLIKPIYLDSIIMKSHNIYMNTALPAFYGRIENYIEILPSDYHLNKPNILFVSNKYSRNTHESEPPEWSTNWIFNNEDYCEKIISKTGVLNNSEPSRICKERLMRHFIELVKKKFEVADTKCIYADLKLGAVEYQRAKNECINAFKRAGLGSWEKVQKPSETDRFHL